MSVVRITKLRRPLFHDTAREVMAQGSKVPLAAKLENMTEAECIHAINVYRTPRKEQEIPEIHVRQHNAV